MNIDVFIGQSIVLRRAVAILCLNIDILIYHSLPWSTLLIVFVPLLL